MSLRIRLLLLVGGMMMLTLLMTTWLAWYELGVEPHDPTVEAEDLDEPMWWRVMEVMARGAIPVLALTGGVWWLLQREVRRVERLTEAAERLSRGHYGEQIPSGTRKDELAQLTDAFNRMSLQVRGAFDHIREFTLHASHELKTPLTVLRNTHERRLTRTPADSPDRDDLASVLDEIHRLTKIVDGLSLLTKADANMLSLEKTPVALDELVREAADDTAALAESQSISVDTPHCDSAIIEGDRHRLRQMLLIVADNAVKYNRPGGRITWSLTRSNGTAIVRVRNTGQQLPQEASARAFDRFFRGEENQSVEGCGLGLSIAKWIAEAHRGGISLAPVEDGTEVTLQLPASGPPAAGAA